MKAKEEEKANVPVVKTDSGLERFHGKVLFPEKPEEANKTLLRVGLPKLPKK